jgi:hypothetical protein
MTEDNSHAGQGPVLLDIGGEVGAVIIGMPAGLIGQEVEARPIAGPALATLGRHSHPAADGPATHDRSHAHGAAGEHRHPMHLVHLVHVGVVQRPSPTGFSASAVFGELVEGSYELYLRPDGPVALTVAVVGGEVSTAQWPL